MRRASPGQGAWRGLGPSARLHVLAAGVAWLLTACAHLEPQALPSEAERHQVTTADGFRLELVRHVPPGEVSGPPVLLVHGITANGRNMDFEEGLSLPRWLAARGHDAWVLSIRGTGGSDDPDPSAGRPAGHSFDTVWQQDLPAAIRYVRAKTGGGAIDYVGHSMGGMLAYAYLSQGGEGIDRLVTLGSPTRLDHGSHTLGAALRLKPLLSPQATLPAGGLSHLAAPFYGWAGDDLMTLLLLNPENVPAPLWRRFMVTGVDDVSGALMLQLSEMVATGRFGSVDGTRDYRADLAKVKTPVLVVAGKRDRFGTPMAVWDGYRSLGGEKRWLMMARTHGTVADYGHMDFLIGVRAPTELWPHLLEFLSRD